MFWAIFPRTIQILLDINKCVFIVFDVEEGDISDIVYQGPRNRGSGANRILYFLKVVLKFLNFLGGRACFS